MVFLVQFGISLHLRLFQKSQIARAAWLKKKKHVRANYSQIELETKWLPI